MDRAKFYNEVRSSLFGGKLSEEQVSGMENLLDVWFNLIVPLSSTPNLTDYLSYNLATAFHETACTMQPIKERGPVSYFNKYEPGTKLGKVLGNTEKGDGYRFRGEGHVQNTGRRNAGVATKRLNELFGLGVDLVSNPEKRGDPLVSALSLYVGNYEGWWTTRKLRDYLVPGKPNFTAARAVVNGKDRAELIAGYALKFKKAIQVASV